MKFIRKFWSCILRWFFRKPNPLTTEYVQDLPDSLNPQAIYIVGENGYVWSIAMVCPCGCGETLQMNALPDAKSRWRIEKHYDQTISIHPSVWRQVGCRSHFYVRNGYIQWCTKGYES